MTLINNINQIMSLIKSNTMPFKYGAILLNGRQILNMSTNCQHETQFNGLTCRKEDVPSVHAEQDCLLGFLNKIQKGQCLL
jgi:hypothetical protein